MAYGKTDANLFGYSDMSEIPNSMLAGRNYGMGTR